MRFTSFSSPSELRYTPCLVWSYLKKTHQLVQCGICPQSKVHAKVSKYSDTCWAQNKKHSMVEEYGQSSLLGCATVPGKWFPMFGRNICQWKILQCDTFLWNIMDNLPTNAAWHLRWSDSLVTPLWQPQNSQRWFFFIQQTFCTMMGTSAHVPAKRMSQI
jgi:hypothetical protein